MLKWEELCKSADFNFRDFLDLIKYNNKFSYLSNDFKKVDEFGGEGLGETAWFVYSVNDGEYHIKVNCGYYSYEGFCWDYVIPQDINVVEKKEVVREEWVYV